jgi:mRNA interferase MazF
MPNTTSFEFGDVVLVRFPFTDQTSTKQRPAVVVSSVAYHRERPDVILMAITSQIRTSTGIGEALIEDWKDAALLKASVIKPIMTTVERSLIQRRLGRLSERDRERLSMCLNAILGNAPEAPRRST